MTESGQLARLAEQRGSRLRYLGRGRRLSLHQVRAIFLVMGTGSLFGVLLVTWFVHQQVVSARQDREEMVALRVFDELEREVSAFLEGENGRAHYGALHQTDPSTWAPFVVGYFKITESGVETVAAEGKTRENERRVRWAARQLKKKSDGKTAGVNRKATVVEEARDEESLDHLLELRKSERSLAEAPGAPKSPAEAFADDEKRSSSGPRIIDKLNRAPVRRQKNVPAPKKKSSEDQFGDYLDRF